MIPLLLYFKWQDLRGDTAVETKATLTVVRARVKSVLIYSKIETVTLFVSME